VANPFVPFFVARLQQVLWVLTLTLTAFRYCELRSYHHIQVIKGDFSEFLDIVAIGALWDTLLVGQSDRSLALNKWCLHFAAKILHFKLSSNAINY
jgi:hypothetical protein